MVIFKIGKGKLKASVCLSGPENLLLVDKL